MSSTSQPPQSVAVLTSRLFDVDSDIRYMSLNDMLSIFNNPQQASFLATDYHQCCKTVDGFLHTLSDTNGEVQNLTVRCCGPFVLKAHPDVLCPFIHKLADLTKFEGLDRTIPAMAIRTIVISLPRPTSSSARSKQVTDAYDAISKVLIPRLVGYVVMPQKDKVRPSAPKGLLEEDLEKGADSNFLDVLTEIARCFGSMLHQDEVKALQEMCWTLLENERTSSVMKKKAVIAISTLAHFYSQALLSQKLSYIIEKMRNVHLTSANRRLYINVIGSMGRAIPGKFGPHLKTLAPFVMSALSQDELDEQMAGMEEEEEKDVHADDVREAALVALEGFISACPSDMTRYMDECLGATLRFLRYDPNMAIADDEDMSGEVEEDDENDFDLEEDFEEEDIADDDNDISWKVRRCAAKTLHTIISVKGKDMLENAETYERVTRALLGRFREREEGVRLEVLHTLAFLIRQTAANQDELDAATLASLAETNGSAAMPQGRKRRRGGSDVSMSDAVKATKYLGLESPEPHSPPRTGPPASLAKISMDIVAGIVNLIKNSSLSTKQASVLVLKDLVIAQDGALGNSMPQILDLLTDSIKTSIEGGRGSVGVSVSSLQDDALELLGKVTAAHSSKVIQPHVAKLIPMLQTAIQSKSLKTSCSALKAEEQLVMALTPPRQASTSQATAAQLDQLLDMVLQVVSSRAADLTTKSQALAVLGTLLGRTLGPKGDKLISVKRKKISFDLLYEASKNETTRLAAIRAIDSVGKTAPPRTKFEQPWFCNVCLELAAQLRKSDRSLRASSLDALRTLISEAQGCQNLDAPTEQQLVILLAPLLMINDLHLVGPSLAVLAALVKDSKADVVSQDLVGNFATLACSPNAYPVLDQLCHLLECIGSRGSGREMMQALLKVGVEGSPSVVGKLIGTLLVSHNGGIGVTVDNFLHELKTTSDTKRKCLTLAILGEVGLRAGKVPGMSPDLFSSYFNVKGDVSLAAAVALGRAAAGPGNAKTYIPAILSHNKRPEELYLVLHAIKELLQWKEDSQEVKPFARPLWDAAVSAANSEDNRPIGAECLANLSMVDPKTYLPSLQVSPYNLNSSPTDSVPGIEWPR